MDAVKLGLIGLGEWPRQAYVPVLKELDNVRVCAVAARSSATQEYAREQFGSQTAVYDDYRDLLQDESVDAVTLALPNNLHNEAIQAAVASRKHVFYEPPIGHADGELRRTLATMAASGRVIQADLELRYLPVIDAVRTLMASGTIGEVLLAKIRLWCDWGHSGGDWNQDPEAEGFFPWLGCWYLDVLDCILDAPPLQASVVGGHAANGDLMDYGWATLEYPDGRIGQFEFNLVAVAGRDIRLSVLGTQGELEADLCSGHFRWRAAHADWQEACHPASQPAHGFEGMRECLIDFFDAVISNRPPKAGVKAAGRVHTAMLACARAEAGKTIVVADTLT